MQATKWRRTPSPAVERVVEVVVVVVIIVVIIVVVKVSGSSNCCCKLKGGSRIRHDYICQEHCKQHRKPYSLMAI